MVLWNEGQGARMDETEGNTLEQSRKASRRSWHLSKGLHEHLPLLMVGIIKTNEVNLGVCIRASHGDIFPEVRFMATEQQAQKC